MPTTVRAEMAHVFDVELYMERRADRWVVFIAKVDSDGGMFHYPKEIFEPEEIDDLEAEVYDSATGADPTTDWDDLTPTQREMMVGLYMEDA
jgi:hypothetical protein